MRQISDTAIILAIAAVGAAIASLIGFPAPFLTCPAAAVSLAGVAGAKLNLPMPLVNFALIMIGMSIGTGVTPEVIDTARQWPASFIVLALSLVVIMIATSRYLMRAHGYDRNTALLSAAPGHLSYVLSLSSDLDADIRKVSIVQSIRVLAITLIIPVAITAMGGSTNLPGTALATMEPLAIALIFVASLAAGMLFKKLRVPAALLIGGMVISTFTHLTGIVSGVMPNWLQMPAFLVMGAMIGSRFSGVTPQMLKSSVTAGFAITVLATALAGAFAAIIAISLGLPITQVLIAFVPGGVEAMVAMAVLLDADPAFVAAHHVMRLFILTALVPLLLGRQKKPQT